MSLATVIIALAAIPANLFLVLYSYWARWWETPAGRYLFLSIGGLALLINLSLSRRAFGEWPGYGVTALVVYVIVTAGLYYGLWLLVRENRPRHRHPSDPADN